LKVPFQSYTFESFIQNLISLGFQPSKRLKIACFLTHFSEWSEDKIPSLINIFRQRGFFLEKMGEVYRISASYFDSDLKKRQRATFYVHLDSETKLLLCFTDEKTEAIDQTFGDVANTSLGIYYMFISPSIFENIRSRIIDAFPEATCYYFTAKHKAQFARKGETRPFVDRTIIYYGEDALQTLQEVQQYYGASPRIMRYRVPDIGNFEVKNLGYFTLINSFSPRQAIKFLLDLVQFVSLNVLRARQIIENSDIVLIPLRTEQKVFEIPKLVPWVVKFGKKLDFKDASYLIDSLVTNGYMLFNYVLAEGSLRLNGLVVDEKKLKIFTIDVDDEKMIIAPREKVSFDVFLRFFATLIDNFDPYAHVEEFA
jgi:hypothetical protein